MTDLHSNAPRGAFSGARPAGRGERVHPSVADSSRTSLSDALELLLAAEQPADVIGALCVALLDLSDELDVTRAELQQARPKTLRQRDRAEASGGVAS